MVLQRSHIRAITLTTAAFAAFSLALPSSASAGIDLSLFKKPFRVVIDPGHGGYDHGTIYTQGSQKIAEKDLTLALAHQTAAQLRAQGFSVILTREKDQDVALPARTALANKLGADVFISIHMNSGGAEGIETYILNNATDASSKRLAQLENSVIEPDSAGSPEQNDVALILKDLRLDANLSESKRLACAVQANLIRGSARAQQAVFPRSPASSPRNRGVKQALFYVLLGADMPSVLVEAGFINSARDRATVLSPAGRKHLALAIAQSVDQFRQSRESRRTAMALNKCKIH
jgi:N-acetylmuramoyl-L-alanine amidase